MRKLLIFVPVLATAAVGSGCSTLGDGVRSLDNIADVIPDTLEKSSLVYKPEVQQGNVVTQEQVNQLLPGMTKRQVRFLLGTPMLTDVFHNNRWDYAYTFGVGSKPTKFSRVSVFFAEDRLVRITGDLRPQPEAEREAPKKEVVVTVPDWEPPKKSLFGRALDAIGLDDD